MYHPTACTRIHLQSIRCVRELLDSVMWGREEEEYGDMINVELNRTSIMGVVWGGIEAPLVGMVIINMIWEPIMGLCIESIYTQFIHSIVNHNCMVYNVSCPNLGVHAWKMLLHSGFRPIVLALRLDTTYIWERGQRFD